MIQVNEVYSERAPLWWFWLLSYAGGEYMRGSSVYSLALPTVRRLSVSRDVSPQLVDYLWQFRGETPAEFQERLARAHYRRLAGAGLDAVVAGVQVGAGQPNVPEGMRPLLDDVDARGSSWTEFRAQLLTGCAGFGHMHVGADLPSPGQDRAAGLPFLYLISPLAMVDWVLDQWGEFTRCVVRELAVRGEGVGYQDRVRYREWTRESVRLLDSSGTPVAGSEQPNPYGFIPITTVYYAVDPLFPDERIGRSWMESPARDNQHHYNVCSWIDEIAFKVTFPQMTIPVPEGESSLPPEVKQAIGVDKALPYTVGGGAPAWISPPRDSVDVLRELRREDERAIKEAAGLVTLDNGSREMPSGEALRQLRVDLGALLGSFGRQGRSGEERVLEMVAAIMGVAGPIEVPYPDDYAAPDSAARLDEIERVYNLGLKDIPRAGGLLLETALQAVLPNAPAEQVKMAAQQIQDRAADAERAAEDGTPKESLNGAQVSSLLEIAKAVTLHEIPRETGIGMIVLAFSLPTEDAERLLGTAGTGPAPAPKVEAAGFPPAKEEEQDDLLARPGGGAGA